MIPHWLWHLLGADGGVWAYIWGGIGSIIVPYIGVYIAYRVHNVCTQHRCWRRGHPYVVDHEGTKVTLHGCHHHHPMLRKGKPFRVREHPATMHHWKQEHASEEAA